MIENGYSICFNAWALDKRIKNELNLLLIVSSLTAEKGYCYASNKYFADLFGIDEVSASRKLKKLENLGFIKIDYEKRGAEVISRKIRLTKMLTDDYQKNQSTINKNVKENNTSIKNTSVNNLKKEKEKKTFTPDLSFCSDSFLKEPFLDWLEYKKQRNESYKTQKSLEACFKLLQKLSFGIMEKAQEIVEQSMANNWAGLFPLKEERRAKNPSIMDQVKEVWDF